MRMPLSMPAVMIALTVAGAAAQTAPFSWSGTAPKIDVRGEVGSIRARRSDDGRIHVFARSSDSDVIVDVRPLDDGIAVCAVSQTYDCGSAAGVRRLRSRVDFDVQVPDGTALSASLIEGDIFVDDVRQEINLATIDGNMSIALRANAGVDLDVNQIQGAIASDFPLRTSGGQIPVAIAPSFRDRYAPPQPPQIVHAVIGRGGQGIRLVTINGNIRLLRR
jgi:hypothetical protein